MTLWPKATWWGKDLFRLTTLWVTGYHWGKSEQELKQGRNLETETGHGGRGECCLLLAPCGLFSRLTASRPQICPPHSLLTGMKNGVCYFRGGFFRNIFRWRQLNDEQSGHHAKRKLLRLNWEVCESGSQPTSGLWRQEICVNYRRSCSTGALSMDSGRGQLLERYLGLTELTARMETQD